MKKKVILSLLFLTGILFSQDNNKKNIWTKFDYLIGSWEGTGKGQSGISSVKLEIKPVMNNRFLQVNGSSVYAPQEKNPKGEKHEDVGYISFSKNQKSYIFRQFHVEGFVNEYVLDSISTDGKKYVFTSKAIENIPAGFRARETYIIINEDELTNIFELAEPGKDFEVYSENHFKKIKTN